MFDWDAFYWDTQSSLVPYDEDFSKYNFAKRTLREIRSRTNAIKREKNSLSKTAAQQAQMFFNANKSENVQSVTSYVQFLPYPFVEKGESNEIAKLLNPKVAYEIINYYNELPWDCRILLDQYKPAILHIAQEY